MRGHHDHDGPGGGGRERKCQHVRLFLGLGSYRTRQGWRVWWCFNVSCKDNVHGVYCKTRCWRRKRIASDTEIRFDMSLCLLYESSEFVVEMRLRRFRGTRVKKVFDRARAPERTFLPADSFVCNL